MKMLNRKFGNVKQHSKLRYFVSESLPYIFSLLDKRRGAFLYSWIHCFPFVIGSGYMLVYCSVFFIRKNGAKGRMVLVT